MEIKRLFFYFYVLSGCLILGSPQARATNAEAKKCAESLMLDPWDLTSEEIFERSSSGPILSDALIVTAEYLALPENKAKVLEVGDESYKWEAYFFGEGSKKTSVSPQVVLQSLKANMLTMRLNDIKYRIAGGGFPTKIIFFNDSIEVSLRKGLLGVELPGKTFTPDNSYALGVVAGLKIKDKSGQRETVLTGDSSVILIGTGHEPGDSMWGSSFVIAHEMAHNSQFRWPMQYFGFFKEARADFLAYLMTGSFTNFASDEGGKRHVVVSAGKSIEELFENRKSIDKYQLGSLFSHSFYEVFRLLESQKEGYLIKSYLYHAFEALMHASPWFRHDHANDVVHIDPSIAADVFDRNTAESLLSDIAGSFMQEAVRRGLPPSRVREIGRVFEKLGSKGPYIKRWSFYDEDSPIPLSPSEKESFDRIPMSWNSADDLARKLP